MWEWKASLKELNITLNGFTSVLDFVSADRPENIEGFGYGNGGGIVLNEAGIILRDRNLWNISILPMSMDGNAWIHFVGTPKGAHDEDGKDTLYYAQYKKGLDPEKFPNWKSFKFSTYDNIKPNGFLEEKVVDEVINEVPIEIRPQEIYGEFIDIKEGQIFKEEWFPIVETLPVDSAFQLKIMSLDTAFKANDESDYSVVLVVYQTRDSYYIVDCICDRLEFPELVHETQRLYGIYKPDAVIVEDKASGQSLVQTLKAYTTCPVLPINPAGDKKVRARAATPVCQAGKIKLLRGSWNRQFIMQMTGFPCGHDDICDAFSLSINYFKDMGPVGSPKDDLPEYLTENLYGDNNTPNSMMGFEEPINMRNF